MGTVSPTYARSASEEPIVSPSASPIVNQFSLVKGGLIYRFQTAINMALPDKHGVLKRALLTTLFTWFPLLILSLIQGQALGHVQIAFLKDFAAELRFLIGLPLLVIAEVVIDPRLNQAVQYFPDSGLVSREDLPAFEDAILAMNRLRDHVVPGLIIVVCAFAPSLWFRETQYLGHPITSWHTVLSPSGERLSLAGWWSGLISVPLFRVLLFRWFWMTFLWTVFLRRVTRVRLGCVASHPDTFAGLGFLGDAETLFGFIALASSAVTAGAFANAIVYQGATVNGLKFLMIASCALPVVAFAAPLVILTPVLMRIRHRDRYHYGKLGTAYAQAFDAKWIGGVNPGREELLGTGDIQSLADLNSSVSAVRDMNVLLINKRVLLGLTIPSVVPFIPLVIINTPTDELVKQVLKILL
jgi:hypothetical protein